MAVEQAVERAGAALGELRARATGDAAGDGRLHRALDAAGERAADLGGLVADRLAPPAFALLRSRAPIVATRRVAVVALADDVREVLSDHASFTVAAYAPRMAEITGPFILGLDDTPLARRDEAALRSAVRPGDADAVGERALAAARARVAAAGDRLDVVADVADPAVEEAARSWLGPVAPDPATHLRWTRSLFQRIFIDVADLPAVRRRALDDAAAMREHLDGVVAARRQALEQGEDVPDDLVSRLLRDGALHDVAIRHNVIGLATGWLPTVSKAVALALEELLRRPDALASAQAAARAGDLEAVRAHAWEALRFRPQNWSLLRTCERDRTLAAGTPRARLVRAGSTVVVGTQSAMFDPAAVPDPERFRPGRPPETYLHFGHGLHRCFGEPFNIRQVPALLQAILEGPDVRRAGRLRWRGPYPSSLLVARDAG